MRFTDLNAWLRWQEGLHPAAIDLGLERVAAVWGRLGPAAVTFPVVTIAGTNGKGSCAAMLDSIYRAGGYRTCCYTSPHLLRYNERIRLNGHPVDDSALCGAFERVDQAREGASLTYFEFGTLAALDLFVRERPDLAILEVGLGGRLDAVNILDPDVSIVTTIGLDHTEYLGDTLDQIAFEKSGILRAGRPAVIGHRTPSPALIGRSEGLGCRLYVLGRDFDWEGEGECWQWRGPGIVHVDLPAPALPGRFQRDNAATALMAQACLATRLPLAAVQLHQGLTQTRLNGRLQVLSGEVTWILDVAHNGQAAEALAANLVSLGCQGRMFAVLGILQGKDPQAIANPLAEQVQGWFLGQAGDKRAMPVAELRSRLAGMAAGADVQSFPDVETALAAAEARARPGDCVLVFGSFTTVEAALRRIHERSSP